MYSLYIYIYIYIYTFPTVLLVTANFMIYYYIILYIIFHDTSYDTGQRIYFIYFYPTYFTVVAFIPGIQSGPFPIIYRKWSTLKSTCVETFVLKRCQLHAPCPSQLQQKKSQCWCLSVFQDNPLSYTFMSLSPKLFKLTNKATLKKVTCE